MPVPGSPFGPGGPCGPAGPAGPFAFQLIGCSEPRQAAAVATARKRPVVACLQAWTTSVSASAAEPTAAQADRMAAARTQPRRRVVRVLGVCIRSSSCR